ncbi:hypothetical protein [Microbacterium sp. cx-59]|uniref:hypothetical protein n=1 Tax=Microbacterium sp. cx-59 TaxID=2891207 RepID=UPI001E3EAB23|nr:hypothetical protein [Microbacterium sp. cx-59]MCC4909344.1 hypothetical protein [Microbacterium sp. cx-59]
MDERTTGDGSTPSELSCDVCRTGVYSGGQPRFVVATSGVDLLYRCDACGTWWIGNERATWPATWAEARTLSPDHVAAATSALSHGVRAYVWGAGGSIPGRHPELVDDAAVRERVEDVIAEADNIRPDAGATDLNSWAAREVAAISTRHPELDEAALRVLRDLLTWTWR